jgi:uncharacterized membrane protein
MRSWLFWTVSGLALAAVVHLSYVLVGTRFALQDMISTEAQAATSGQFTLLAPEEQLRLLGESEDDAVAGRCLFDLKGGALAIDAAMPDGFWSLTIYSQSGQEVYSINDRQAGTNRFKLTVKRTPGLLSFFTSSDTPDTKPSENEGWSAEIGADRGFAIFWAALDQPQMRPSMARELARTTCTAERKS